MRRGSKEENWQLELYGIYLEAGEDTILSGK
jgi:hypothetical protein